MKQLSTEGMASFTERKYFKAFEKIVKGILKSPSALWGNGPVRRFFGARI